ncbi:unnamed protein product [Cuscuta epithymum]|uniref:PNPLA domain-containing protein n=1 Tax=Cuscuta epithymum TaxID=186058 RepID=A0AAV0EW07_9ASTE|nr:unnamed protein product [Cuscuta epithymum]
MAAVSTISMLDSTFESDNLTNQIFSILENKFLFGCNDQRSSDSSVMSSFPGAGKVRILSIDGSGSTGGVLAAKSLVRLEAALRAKSENPNAHIADFFDVVAGSGVGGVLAGFLFTRGKDGSPLLTAGEALRFVLENGRRISRPEQSGVFRRAFKPSKLFKKVFGESTLKDTLKSVLIPCYDLTTGAPFLFSRADAFEMDTCDFLMADVCGATVAHRAVELRSVDGGMRTTAVGGDVAMNNPTAAAITHVLNNKQEFPFSVGVNDLLVVSLGNGESDSGTVNLTPSSFVKIVGCGVSDMVDQAVSMAFSQSGSKSNYIRIQGQGPFGKKNERKSESESAMADEMLNQKNVESVLFQGKRLAQASNLEKLDHFASELVKEQNRRSTSVLPAVVLKQAATTASSPRTSSSTILSSNSSC